MRAGRVPSWLVALCLVLVPLPSRGHDLGTTDVLLAPHADGLLAVVDLDLLAFGDIDTDGDARVGYRELDVALERIFAAWKAHVRLEVEDAFGSVTLAAHHLALDHVLHAEIVYRTGRPATAVVVESSLHRLLGGDHRLVVMTRSGVSRSVTVLDAAHPSANVDLAGSTLPRWRGMILAAAAASATITVLYLRRRGAAP